MLDFTDKTMACSQTGDKQLSELVMAYMQQGIYASLSFNDFSNSKFKRCINHCN